MTINTNVQSDLDTYLNEKRVQTIMATLVERLLLSESITPHASLVEYLCEQYPEQAILALELTRPPKGSSTALLAKNITAVMKNDDDTEDDEDSDVDQFDGGSRPTSPPQLAQHKKQASNKAFNPSRRRHSVSSESLDPTRLREQISQLAIYPKDPEVSQTLYGVVSRAPMLRRMLDPEERALIVKAFAGPVIVQADEVIIRQGDVGDVFYLLEKGTVDVFVHAAEGGGERKVHSYHDGDTFGQLALMYNAPRAATCQAVTDVKLWTLDRIAFKVIIAGAAMRKREIFSTFLKKVPILQSLTEMEVLTLADALTEERFEPNAVICKEKEPGDEFYLVSEGTAECYQRSADGSEHLVGSLGPGQYFGEIALLTTKPRQATVKATSHLKLLVTDRATFTRVLGPLQDALKRNMENYRKITASL